VKSAKERRKNTQFPIVNITSAKPTKEISSPIKEAGSVPTTPKSHTVMTVVSPPKFSSPKTSKPQLSCDVESM
jgi:hypothetical protein